MDLQETTDNTTNTGANKPKLWSWNFTTLTIGSFISIAGGTAIYMAIGLLVLDLCHSEKIYSVYLALGNFISVVVPVLCANFVEHHHKVRVIYLLDFITAFMLLGMGFITSLNRVSVLVIILIVILLRIATNTYTVAYGSLYPMIVHKDIYHKGYSVSNLVRMFAEGAELFGTVAYAFWGITTVLYVCGILFLIAAIFETRIKIEENPKEINISTKSLSNSINDYRELITFLKEKPYLIKTLCIESICFFQEGVFWCLILPFFKISHVDWYVFGLHAELLYTAVAVFFSVGQFWGSIFVYKVPASYKKHYHFFIITVLIEAISTVILFAVPIIPMVILIFLYGFSVTAAYCIIQSNAIKHLPTTMLSRFNGIQTACTALGLVLGNLFAGIFVDYIGTEIIMIITGIIQLIVIAWVFLYNKNNFLKLFKNPQ